MGTTLREVVYDIGGGVAGGKRAQGRSRPAGRPAAASRPRWLDLPIDFDTLTKAGSIMGSGGMIVLDEDDCMVDVAKFFMAFSQDESCGKCTPCREGTTRMLEILERITGGQGTAGRPRQARAAGAAGQEGVAVRAGPRGAQPRAQHAGALPRRVPGPRDRATLPGEEVRRP